MNTNGLSDKEVLESRKKYGSNTLSKIKSDSLFELFLESLGDPIIKILLIALIIKVVFLIKSFDIFETIGILIAILISSFVSTISEYGSEKAFIKMQEEASNIKCKVKRNNKIITIPYSLTTLADYLSVDRSAMMRELKSLSDEGFIIKESKNKIKLLY